MSEHLDQKTELTAEHRVVLYPTLGYFHAEQRVWRVLAQGRVFRHVAVPFSKRLLMRGLQRVMNVPRQLFKEETFKARLEGFLVASDSGLRIVLSIGGQRFVLKKKTRKSGQFQGVLELPDSVVRKYQSLDQHATFQVPIQLAGGSAEQSAVATAFLVPPHGLSVISDIDDTIKQTNVTQKRAMLANTFVFPFEPVDGMAAVYRHWASLGAVFHYVSSSPWQIYDPLAKFFHEFEFPIGSMHLRWFRIRDEMFRRWQILRRKGKAGIIANLIKRCPGRKFVLVGDSGERDPEIYARLVKRFPEQIVLVLIRQIHDRPVDSKRLQKLSKHLGDRSIQLFEQAEEIRDAIDHLHLSQRSI